MCTNYLLEAGYARRPKVVHRERTQNLSSPFALSIRPLGLEPPLPSPYNEGFPVSRDE